MLSCSKGSRGLFVPLRVIGIFTDTTISPSSRLRQCPFQHRAGVRLYTSSLNFAQPCVFVKQLPGPILCALPFSRDPFSRSYRVNLPSSLTVNLSSALVCSTRPRVSVSGTGTSNICLEDFLGSLITIAIRLSEDARYFQVRLAVRICLYRHYLHSLTCYSVSRRMCHFSVSPSLFNVVTEY